MILEPVIFWWHWPCAFVMELWLLNEFDCSLNQREVMLQLPFDDNDINEEAIRMLLITQSNYGILFIIRSLPFSIYCFHIFPFRHFTFISLFFFSYFVLIFFLSAILVFFLRFNFSAKKKCEYDPLFNGL